MPAAPLILALDVGTSSVRAALFTTAAERLLETSAQQTYTLRVAADGTAELDVRQLEQATVRVIKKTLAARRKLRGHPPVIAVAASCFWHSLLGEKTGHPTPVYTWGDGRCQADADRLRATLNEKSYHAQTGCLLRTPYWPAKLRWLHRTGKMTGIERWLSPADWLYGRLRGSFTTSISMASGTGLMDGKRLCWDAALLRRCHVSERRLAPISDEPLGAADGPGAMLPALHRFPELRDAKWFPALGDGACGNLGSDAVTPGRAALNIGTSGAVRIMCPDRPTHVPYGLFCYQVDARRALLGGAISNAGNLRAWALRELRLPDDPRRVKRALAGRELPNHGLTVLPFWTGERSLTWPEARSGTITGLTYATTALDVLQALNESAYHRLAQITDELARGRDRLDLVVSGGIRHSTASLQRLADVLGRPLRACTEPEASLRGAAVFAAERLGHRVKKLKPGRLFRPRKRAMEAYAQAREKQIALEKKLAE
jgi:gluconokinase